MEEDQDPNLSSLEPPNDPDLDRLESRINDLKKPGNPNRKFARGLALVTTLGFLVVGCILAGYYLGTYLEAKYDSRLYMVVCLLGGILAGAYSGYRTMQPLLENDES